jgi:hypothetical protein
MATLTIVKDDKWVNVDGLGLNLDTVDLPANVHAVQFDGTSNKDITSISAYSTITDAHATLKAANETAATQAANEQTALEATYGYKRQNDETTSYPEINEQLDQLYKDMLAGKLDTTGTWATGIKAVKDAHPK